MKINQKHLVIVFILILCVMTACEQAPNSREQNGVKIATGDSPFNEESTDNQAVEDEVDTTSDDSVEQKILNILSDYANLTVEQTIDCADGATLSINADVNLDGIERVSQYEYILKDITEEERASLFEVVFSERAADAEHDKRNDVWTLEIGPERNYFLYQLSYSNGGATVAGEQIIVLENRYYDLYPFEDNRLASVSDSTVTQPLEEIILICKQVVDSITESEVYATDYIHAYGNNGRRPYYKIVFKKMMDGMPITTYNNLSLLYDNDGIEMVKGALFSMNEIGLEEPILSLDKALAKLNDQAAFLNFEGKSQVTVSQITLEYVVLNSFEGPTLVTPVWRFWLGADEDERNFQRQKILAIDAVTGTLVWEERGNTM